MKSGKALLKKYIETNHKDYGEQCIVSIEYEDLNQYCIDETGKSFWDLLIYRYIDMMPTIFNTNTTFKLVNVPENVNLHDLDASYNNKWVSCKAMIKNITDTRVDLKRACYMCTSCNRIYYINVSDPLQTEVKPTECSDCSGKTFKLLKDESEYRNVKYVKLEEPLEIRTGGATREFKGILLDYLASPHHNLKAGDVVDLTGTFKVEPRKKRGKKDGYEFIIHVHNITPVEDVFEDTRITEEDKQKILALSEKENIFQILTDNIAPEVHGHDFIKKALILILFEGRRPLDNVFKADNMERWTINLLLIGDPGIGKSQLLQSVKKRAPKVIGVSGTNSSQAGLTVSAVKDELTGTWTLEAGACVLADTGILCIDEFDKLSKTAQKSLNEPMEQLSVGSAKAGLVQTMSARTSIIAAANPKYSRFNNIKDMKDQLDIPESTLSRFDLIFVMNDDINVDKDKDLADALLNREFNMGNVELLDIDLFKKYVTFMKANVHPRLGDDAKKMLTDFYVNTRQAALHNSDGKPITARDLKALERLSIARAKVNNREVVTVSDVEDVLTIYVYALESVGLTPETAGAIQSVLSNKELDAIEDMELMIRRKVDFEGFPLSSESLKNLEVECGMLCYERGITNESIFNTALENVEKSL